MAKRKLPINKNDEITVKIDSVTGQGVGVGRYEGLAVFVEGGLIGEEILAHVIKVKPSYAVAKMKQIITRSPDRVNGDCYAYSTCGGCTLMHLKYEAQLEVKRLEVADSMERLGGFKGVNVLPTIGMDKPERYRNKGSFPIACSDGKIEIGFYKYHSHVLVPIEDCLIQKKPITDVARAVKKWANDNNISAYNEETQTGILRHVMARTNAAETQTMAVIVTTGPLPKVRELIETLKENVDGLVSIIHNVNKKNTNVIFGDNFDVIWGKDSIVERINGINFKVSAASFLQVNPTQTTRLYNSAIKALDLKGDETIVDVFCGIGTMSLMIAKKAEQVVGIEIVHEAIVDARSNALENGIENAEFICADAEEALPLLVASGKKIDGIMLDPPRKGCDEKTLNAIIQSNTKRVVYVSCNPATLARDCRILCDNGYEVKSVQPVDMFPHSGHIESIALLCKKNV